MNTHVRDYLIQLAQKEKSASYSELVKNCNLNLDLNNIQDRNILSETLGDISVFEHQNKRPLLSAMVLYKSSPNKQRHSYKPENSHGGGFYEICEQLGIGDAKKLETEYFGFKEMQNCISYWRKERQQESPTYSLPFFTQSELEDFSDIIKSKYRTGDEESMVNAEKVKLIYEKTNFWAKQLKIEGFEVQEDNNWQNSGNFKKYSWARIYRKTDKDKKIFFTVGYDTNSNGGGLVYKLDCQWANKDSNKRLTEIQIQRFRDYIEDTGARWRQINTNRISEYDWNKIIIEARTFVNTYTSLYDEIVDFVWSNKEITEYTISD